MDPVPFDAEAAGMLTVAQARKAFEATEPLGTVTFWTGEPDIEVTYGKGWGEVEPGEAAAAWLKLPGGSCCQLTRQAADMLGSTAKANKKFQLFIPSELLSKIVTWALREGLPERELKLLLAGEGEDPDGNAVPLAVAQTRATVEQFSNLRLLDIVLLAARAELGDDAADSAVIDYKFFHDSEHTSFRVVFPKSAWLLNGDVDDPWFCGIEVINSLSGARQTELAGYLFRGATTAGIPDVEHSSGGFSRRGSAPDDVYGWAAESVQEIFGHLADAFRGLTKLTAQSVDDEYGSVLRQFFKESPVAAELKLRILADLEESPQELTMFDLAHAAARAANADGASWREVRSLQLLAGHILHQGGGMCDGSLPGGCRRILPTGWEAPQAS